MYVSEAFAKSSNEFFLETREVRGVKALTAVMVAELFCSHDGSCQESFCLISPPQWSYWIGVGSRFSIGSWLWRLGQWATCMDHPIVREVPITPEEAIASFGWDPGAVESIFCDSDLDD